MKVFVLDPGVAQNPKFNMSSLERYGSPVFLFDKPWTMSPHKPASSLRAMKRALEVKGFDPFHDAFCLTGPFHIINLLVWALARTYEPLRVLMFDARTDSY